MLSAQNIKDQIKSDTSSESLAKSFSLYSDETIDEVEYSLLDLFTSDSGDHVSTSTPSQESSVLQSKLATRDLENIEAVVQWIIKNKPFLMASFNNKLTQWAEEKLNADKSFETHTKTLDLFTKEFKASMEQSRDVRLVMESIGGPYPDIIACFIDAVAGLTDPLIRNGAILPNQNNELLRIFLCENTVITHFLAIHLPNLNEVASIWAKEHPEQLLQKDTVGLSPVKPEVKARFEAKSPKNPMPIRDISLAERMLALESANRQFRLKLNQLALNELTQSSPQQSPIVPQHSPQKENKDDNGITTVAKSAADSFERKETCPDKSMGELVAGSMNSFLRLATPPNSPGKRAHTEPVVDRLSANGIVGSHLHLQDGDDKEPSVVQTAKVRRLTPTTI